MRTEKEEKLKDGENETIEEEKGDDRSQKQWRKRTKGREVTERVIARRE